MTQTTDRNQESLFDAYLAQSVRIAKELERFHKEEFDHPNRRLSSLLRAGPAGRVLHCEYGAAEMAAVVAFWQREGRPDETFPEFLRTRLAEIERDALQEARSPTRSTCPLVNFTEQEKNSWRVRYCEDMRRLLRDYPH